MRRRKFISLLGGAVAGSILPPLRARAQRSTVPIVGVLGVESHDMQTNRYRAFHQGLGETGYVEGRNLTIEYRWSETRNDRMPTLAADLVGGQVAVIAALGGFPAAMAAKAATTTIPIVFQGGFDPVELGMVDSLNRPGGNLTGVSSLNAELGPKRLELLHELVPMAKAVALLVNPAHPNAEQQLTDLQAAAQTMGLHVHVVHARTERDLDAIFASVASLRADALVISTTAPFVSRATQLGRMAARHAVPTIFQNREFATSGGLISYHGSETDAFHLAGGYTGRILKGEKPSDLPVQRVTKIEMIINLNAAKALGLNVPLPLLGRADEVIE
jgi:putative ABC transport system substrate-binding protein